MNEAARFEDLPLGELRRIIDASPAALSGKQRTDRQQFIDRIGGVENALNALSMLSSLED